MSQKKRANKNWGKRFPEEPERVGGASRCVDFRRFNGRVFDSAGAKLLCFSEGGKVASEITVVNPMNNKCRVVGI